MTHQTPEAVPFKEQLRASLQRESLNFSTLQILTRSSMIET